MRSALAHTDAPSVPPAEIAAGGERLADAVVPCLVGATTDDPVAYHLGASFRTAALGTAIAGILLVTIALAVGSRLRPVWRVGALFAATLVLLVSAGMGAMILRAPAFVAHTAHEHANLVVSVRGTPIDLTQERFQSNEGHVLSDFAHLHDGNGHVVHAHAAGVTYGYFLWSIGLPLRGSCMGQPDGTTLCNDGAYRWIALVDGVFEPNLRDRPVKDLERVLLAYTDEAEDSLRRRFEQLVPDDACIASKKCPERGTPAPESCDL